MKIEQSKCNWSFTAKYVSTSYALCIRIRHSYNQAFNIREKVLEGTSRLLPNFKTLKTQGETEREVQNMGEKQVKMRSQGKSQRHYIVAKEK